LSTLIVPLYLRTRGWVVPKLGVTGRPAGGVDVLKTIPDYDASPSLARVRTQLRESGYVHIEAKGSWAPLDARLFRLRQDAGLQAVPPLVIASILAKKLAVGVCRVGLEIRISGDGNFGRSVEEGRRNARRFINVARLLSLEPRCVLTHASLPYQPYVGRGEALMALDDVLEGRANRWLSTHVGLCRRMTDAVVGGRDLPQDEDAALKGVHTALLEAHCSSYDKFSERVLYVRGQQRTEVVARQRGWPVYDLSAIRGLLVRRQREAEEVDRGTSDPAGLIVLAQPDRQVTSGEPLASIRVPRGESGLLDALAGCVSVGKAATVHDGPDTMEVVGA
jgi:thymidine phosphorylase